MIEIRPAGERGLTRLGWLKSFHTFSFNSYVDSRYMGFGPLRVINDDVIAPGAGFDMHFHRDMEILTYVLSGELQHKDSLGNGSVIRPGEVQRMSAGTGIMHSEFNPSPDQPVHLLQIWIRPAQHDLAPSYEQQPIEHDGSPLTLIAGPEAKDKGVEVHQDARVYVGDLKAGQETRCELTTYHVAWVQVTRGTVAVNGSLLQEGDGAAIENEHALALEGKTDCEFLLFDMERV